MTKRNIVVLTITLSLLLSLTVSAATVKGTLVNLKKEILPLSKVFLTGKDVPALETITDDKGIFTFTNILPGEWTLTAEDEKIGSIKVDLIILKNEEANEYKIIAWEKLYLGNKGTAKWLEIAQSLNNEFNEETLAELEELIKEYPNFYNAYGLKGKVLYLNNKEEEAIPILKKTLEMNPYEPQANQLLAFYYSDKKKYKAAVKHYEYLLMSKPNDAKILNDLGDKFYILKNYKKSSELLAAAIKYYPNQKSAAMAYFFLGDSYLKTGKLKEALPVFEKFLSTSPNHAYAKDAKRVVVALKNKFKKEKEKKEGK